MVRSNGWRTLALVVAGVLALAGCGVSGGEHGAPGSSGGEHAAPGSSGGELSIEEARTHYEEIVAPANCTSAAFIQGAAALQASTTLADAEAALQPLAVPLAHMCTSMAAPHLATPQRGGFTRQFSCLG